MNLIKKKIKFISYIFNLWDRNQINSLNEVNPNLLVDSIDIEIFNPSSIDYHYLVNEVKEYWNYTFNLYRLYPKEYRKLIPMFERLSFEEKKDILVELFLVIEHDELLPDNIDSLKQLEELKNINY